MSLIGAGYLGFALIQLPHDKLIHFSTFLILTVEFYFLFDTNHKSLKTLRYITLLVCTFGGSIALEIIQSLVNLHRVFDLYDILFNVLGSSLGVLICSVCDTWLAKKQRRNRYRLLRTVDIVPEADDDDDTEGDLVVTSEGDETSNGFITITMNDLERQSL